MGCTGVERRTYSRGCRIAKLEWHEEFFLSHSFLFVEVVLCCVWILESLKFGFVLVGYLYCYRKHGVVIEVPIELHRAIALHACERSSHRR